MNDNGGSVSISWGDYDNDGDLDAFVGNSLYDGVRSHIYRNDGSGNFERLTDCVMAELTVLGTGAGSWGDYDNDGYLDLFISCRHPQTNTNFLYHNNGDGTFAKVENDAIVTDPGKSLGATWVDYDLDGDLDMFVTNGLGHPGGYNENNQLYENTGTTGNWLGINCKGTESNSYAIGTVVRAKLDLLGEPTWLMRHIASMSGRGSQTPYTVHFGLGDATVVDSLIIEWPSGIVQTLTNVDVNQFIEVIEARDSFEITVDSKFGGFNEDVLLPVRISANEYNLSSFEIDFSGFDSNLEFVEIITENSLLENLGWMHAVNPLEGGLTTAFSGSEDIADDGILFYLKFNTSDVEGFVPVNIESVVFNTGDIEYATSNGGVHILPILYGDADLNGVVQAFDAGQILKEITGTVDFSLLQSVNGDVSLDGTLSALDASIILQYVVGLIDTLPHNPDYANGAGIIAVNDQYITPGSLIDIPIIVESAEGIYSIESEIEFDLDALEFVEADFSSIPAGVNIEVNNDGGKLYLAGACSSELTAEQSLISLRFRVRENFVAETSSLCLNKVRYNENATLHNCGQALLTNSLQSSNDKIIPFVSKIGNSPNPFNPKTKIFFSLNSPASVNLTVFNVKGQEVKTLENRKLEAGAHEYIWNGEDNSGSSMSSGIYFYRLQSEHFTQTKKMLLLK